MIIGKQARPLGNFSFRSLLTFLLVGGLATAVQYAIALFCVFVLGWTVVVGSVLGFAVSAVLNYLLNARLTFKSLQSHKKTAPKFVAVAGSGLLLNYALLTFLLSLSIHAAIAQALTTIGVLIWNFVINAIWTFQHKTR